MSFEEAIVYEKSGRLIHKNTPVLGSWIWKLKRKWFSLSHKEQECLLQLQSFQGFNPYTFEEEEWDRMFLLCREYEMKTGSLVSYKTDYLNESLGKWLSTQKGHITKYLNRVLVTDRVKERYKKLETLNTISHWLISRKMLDSFATMSIATHYETLEVSKSACTEVIKAAFKALALKHHPDKGGSSEKMKSLTTAYSVLINEQQRKEYDLTIFR